jgi:hypothetical protein
MIANPMRIALFAAKVLVWRCSATEQIPGVVMAADTVMSDRKTPEMVLDVKKTSRNCNRRHALLVFASLD